MMIYTLTANKTLDIKQFTSEQDAFKYIDTVIEAANQSQPFITYNFVRRRRERITGIIELGIVWVENKALDSNLWFNMSLVPLIYEFVEVAS